MNIYADCEVQAACGPSQTSPETLNPLDWSFRLGYIGSHTVVKLTENGFKVSIMDNLLNSSEKARERSSWSVKSSALIFSGCKSHLVQTYHCLCDQILQRFRIFRYRYHIQTIFPENSQQRRSLAKPDSVCFTMLFTPFHYCFTTP